MILEAEPAELVATWAGHVGAACCLFDWDFAFGALVRQKQEVYKPDDALEVESCGVDEHCVTLGALLVDVDFPFALLDHENVVAVLGRTLLDVGRKR